MEFYTLKNKTMHNSSKCQYIVQGTHKNRSLFIGRTDALENMSDSECKGKHFSYLHKGENMFRFVLTIIIVRCFGINVRRSSNRFHVYEPIKWKAFSVLVNITYKMSK